MPILPIIPKALRRNGATPIPRTRLDDVWGRTLDMMGLEPLKNNTNTAAMVEMVESSPTIASSSLKKLTILDLPLEVQKELFKYSTPTCLIALCLVSKHFRDIASEHLYRSFHIVFPDDEDPANDYPIDGLAGGLETFVTSDYDYARYLREIVMETIGPYSHKTENAYRNYLYDVSCGKFMNTLFLLTLRKAKALETFRWDIRVELSRQVFKALHDTRALQNLHLRMQVGPSVYQAPPALPTSTIHNLPNLPGPGPGPPPPGHHAIMLPPPPMTTTSSGNFPNSFAIGSKATAKSKKKAAKALLPAAKTPPTLSGFKNLKSLSILDMDTYEYIDELKLCIQNSSTTLNTLQISFSESLATKSRKPPPEPQSDDESDQEDEFGNLIPPGPPPPSAGASDPNGPSKAFKALEEKKKQEAVLGKIFGLEPAVIKTKPTKPCKSQPEIKTDDDPKIRFIRNLAPVAARLMAHVRPGSNLAAEGKVTLDLIEEAVQLYMSSMNQGKEKDTTSAGGGTGKATPASSSASTDGIPENEPVMNAVVSAPEMPGLFDTPQSKKKESSAESGVANPDDIDIEEPEYEELSIEFDGATTEEQHVSSETSEVVDALPDKFNGVKNDGSSPRSTIDIHSASFFEKCEFLDHIITSDSSPESIRKESEDVKAEMLALKGKSPEGVPVTMSDALFAQFSHRIDQVCLKMNDANVQVEDLVVLEPKSIEGLDISNYVRSTRGLTLNTLAIYLIPIRATLLSRAVDFSVLQNITLLNVGPQTPLWNLLSREYTLSEFKMRKIHTDNVTLPFLAFVSQLKALEELYLLERTSKSRVESTAARTTVTMELIRKAILKKHASTLKVLMIRNDQNSEWDMNVRTAMLLCNRAAQLEELSVSFGIRAMHALLQHIHGLVSLRALHTILFRTNDTCTWVMNEFRKFTVDTISHNQDMKLEYLALGESVERLVRRKPKSKLKAQKVDVKGKGKETAMSSMLLAELLTGSGRISLSGNSGSVSGMSSAGLSGLSFDLMENSDDENDGLDYGKTGLRIETVEGIRFCDVSGVKIFEKEILGGRL